MAQMDYPGSFLSFARRIRFSDSHAILPCGVLLPLDELGAELREAGDDLDLTWDERLRTIAHYLAIRDIAECDSRFEILSMIECGRSVLRNRDPEILQ